MNTKRHYETTVIINGSLEEKQISDAVIRVSEFIKKNGGEIESSDEWGRRRLAYPIQKKNNGYYVQFAFKSSEDVAKELATFCRIDDDILRELTLVMSELDLKRREETKVRIAEADAAAEEEEHEGSSRRGADDDDDDDA